MFDRHGKLLAATIQEGLVREKRSRPEMDSKL
jgi:acyl-CoA thioesterase